MKLAICFLVFISFATAQCNYAAPVFVRYVPNALRHTINSPGFPRNHIYDPYVFVGSDVGLYTNRVNLNNGEIATFIAAPNGDADDMDFNPQGEVVIMSLLSGLVRSAAPNPNNPTGPRTPIVVFETNPVSPNGVSFNQNGSCYFSQNPNGDALYKIDPTGATPPVFILDFAQPMNGFDFGPDGEIYGPLNNLGTVVKVNVQTKTVTTIASGFIDPEGVRWDENKTKLYVLDDGINTIYQMDPVTAKRTPIFSLPEPNYIDNFRVYHDSFVIAEQIHNAVLQYNLTTGITKVVTPWTPFSIPMGISFLGETLFIADYVTLKTYFVPADEIVTIARGGPQPINNDFSYGVFDVFVNRNFTVLSCNYDSRVQVRETNGNALVANIVLDGGNGWPYGTAMSTDLTTVIVNDYGTGLEVFTGAQYQNEKLLTSFPHVNLTGMALDTTQTNFVYVADYTTGDLIHVNYNTGAYTIVYQGLHHPEGIAFNVESGVKYVYVVEVGNQSVSKISINTNSATNTKTVIATGLPIGLQGPATLPAPYSFSGVSIHPSGDVYVSSDLDDTILKIAKLS